MAGVSAQTISRFFKDPDTVKPANRARIARIVSETGYYPNPAARSLSSNRTNLVAAIVPTIDHSIFSAAISGLSGTLENSDFELLIASNNFSLEKEEQLIKRFLAQKVAGIVLVGQQHTEQARAVLRKAGIPVVELLEIDGPAIGTSVGLSNFAAAHDLTTGLLRRGLCRIGFISAPVAGNDRVQRRLDGYRAALEDAGLGFEPSLVGAGDFAIENGARIFRDMIRAHPDLQGVVSNDILGLGVQLECARLKIDVPGQIAITGFDDLEISSILDPQLTTVRIGGFQMGVTAAQTILNRQSDTEPRSEVIDLGYEILWRGTTPAGRA